MPCGSVSLVWLLQAEEPLQLLQPPVHALMCPVKNSLDACAAATAVDCICTSPDQTRDSWLEFATAAIAVNLLLLLSATGQAGAQWQ